MKGIYCLKTAAYLYVILPLIIFVLMWMKLYLGVPLAIAIGLATYRMILDTKLRSDYENKQLNRAKIIKILFAIAIILLWVYLSGVGGFVWQNKDHYWRNEIFNLLIDYKWPVVQGSSLGAKGMSYYIGFWIVPALIGKLFGVGAGYTAQYIWAVIGVAIFYGLLCRRIGKLALLPLVIFIFFSGLDIVGLLINNTKDFINMQPGEHIEIWIRGYQFSSFTTQLFWVFNQAIYAWVITLLVLDEQNKNIVLIMAAGLLSTTLPIVGLFPIAVYVMVKSAVKTATTNRVKDVVAELFRSSFSYVNIVGVASTIVLGMMFIGNNATSMTENKATAHNNVWSYLLFLLVEIGVYAVITFRRNRKDGLYISAIIMLLICPLIIIGEGADFCMRACIPAQIILFIYFIEYVYDCFQNKRTKILVIIAVFFLTGATTPFNEIYRTIDNAKEFSKNGMEVARKDEVFEVVNFASDTDKNLFYKYLSPGQ